ncbi:hypothetical protein GSU69_04970 [Rathayibacter festucae]|uniref:Cardiolipin synthase N-terminal domain-containing protein n=1 Tax=Rathayibacter festucae TaxID=110937 RepID=A0ABX6GX49_9MICO|nr:PLD nuclease N-terminal domain-containing protein [Rathayibacter festucae]QHC62100.1 hypothetical protein GSU69_04970 [Rathayibacter festucae]
MNTQSLLVILNIVLLILAIRGVLANGRLSKVAKVGWVALIVILPFAGSIAYLVFGRRASGGGTSSGPQRPTGWFFER